MKIREKVICIFLVILLGINLTGCGKDFDAKGFTQAKLDLLFQGDTQGMQKFDKIHTARELEEDYEQQVDNLVYSILTSNILVDDTAFSKYANLMEELLSVTQYSVESVEKQDKKHYDVKVKATTEDVFVTFIPKLKELSDKINKDKQNGVYKGTEEEINQAMVDDYVDGAYSLLEESYLNMQTGEEISMKLAVTSEDGKTFEISEKEISKLLTKILRLNEKQG